MSLDALHPQLSHQIVNALGWTSLREVQRRAIEPIRSGANVVLLAPTAGGKTEAAFFPLLSDLLESNWSGLSILYLSPLRALLNNQHERLERLCGLIGHRVGVWHGDVGQPERRRIRADPPSVLLTTPESLEAMLISSTTRGEHMFGGLRAVVIDEVHAFAGADRGWHLLGVLERLSKYAGRDLQRIGLSATVGNRDEIVEWLSAGSARARRTVDPGGGQPRPPEVQLDYVGTLENAARVIKVLHRGKRRLVFCDSRLQAERLTRALRQREVTTHIIHGSLSAPERRHTERQFVEGGPGVIVATSALELGIDIGDLDHVLNLDAPGTVASFLQRMGRTGRREGAHANMTFLAIEERGLVRAAALIDLWERGYVEPATPPGQPLHVLAQQVIATTLERPGLSIADLKDALRPFLEAAHIDPAHASALLRHLFARGYLHADGARVGVGPRTESELGHRHYMQMVSVFTTPPVFTVMHGRRELGQVDQSTFFSAKNDAPTNRTILLAGRSWWVDSIAWSKKIAYVEPLDLPGKSNWRGSPPPTTAALAEAHRRVLMGEQLGEARWSKRARERLAEICLEFEFLEPEGDCWTQGDRLECWNFAGTHANTLLAARVEASTGDRPGVDPLKLTFIDDSVLVAKARHADALEATGYPEIPADHPAADTLKFHDLLPDDLVSLALAARMYGEGS